MVKLWLITCLLIIYSIPPNPVEASPNRKVKPFSYNYASYQQKDSGTKKEEEEVNPHTPYKKNPQRLDKQKGRTFTSDHSSEEDEVQPKGRGFFSGLAAKLVNNVFKKPPARSGKISPKELHAQNEKKESKYKVMPPGHARKKAGWAKMAGRGMGDVDREEDTSSMQEYDSPPSSTEVKGREESGEKDDDPIPQKGRSFFFPKFLLGNAKPNKRRTVWTKMSGRSMGGGGFANPNEKVEKHSEEDITSKEIAKNKRKRKKDKSAGVKEQTGRGWFGGGGQKQKPRKKAGWTKMSGRKFDEDDENTDLDNGTADGAGGDGAAAATEAAAAEPNATPKAGEEDFPTDEGSTTEGSIQPQFDPPAGGGGEQYNLTCMEMEPEGGAAPAADGTEDSWKWKNIHIWVPKGKGYTEKGISNLKLAVDQMKTFLPCMNWTVKVEEKGDKRPTKDHLYLDPEMDTVCSSFVGRVNPGPDGQKFSLSDKCLVYNIVVIQHELLHALGWSHEQRREDRDDYIDILWFNVKQPSDKQFDVKVGALAGGPYDINSIMHYPTNWTKATMGGPVFMDKKNPEQYVGPINTVTATDKLKMKNVYCPNWDYEKNAKKVCKKKLVVAGWEKKTTAAPDDASTTTTEASADNNDNGGVSPPPPPPPPPPPSAKKTASPPPSAKKTA